MDPCGGVRVAVEAATAAPGLELEEEELPWTIVGRGKRGTAYDGTEDLHSSALSLTGGLAKRCFTLWK
jgi:hypothetical protein